MKINKLLSNIALTIFLVSSVFLVAAPKGFAQETDQGWSAPVNLSLSGAASNPVMVVDSIGRIHAIWVDDVDGYRYSQSRDDGKTWSEPQTVKFPFGPKDPSPVLLPGPKGSIHVFWISSGKSSDDQNSSSQGASLKRLSYAQATSGDLAYPENWILSYPLSNDVASYDVIADAQGGLHVAYIRNKIGDDSPVGVYYIQSPSAGGYWIEPRLLYQSDYFRTAKQSDLYIRVSTSNVSSGQKVFVTWDNRAQKRVFMAVSKDTGLDWNDAQQIKGPEDTGGFDTPFNLTVASYGRNLLLIWQVGAPGSSQCIIYSQWSDDGGENWADPVAVLGGRSECPLSTRVVGRDDKYISVLFKGQVNPVLIAWDGAQWSDLQSQFQLPSISNPFTFDTILLGCRFDLFYQDRVYVTGCDQGNGKDVWFLSRTIEPVENWFSPLEVWGEPVVLSVELNDAEKISDFTSVADNSGNVHAVWVQSPDQRGIEFEESSIGYARWNGTQWTTPEIVRSLNGSPLQISMVTDFSDRLLLTWVDGYNGDLDFSWANLERANLSSEWEDEIGLPIPSRLVNASDVIVDGSGRIINVYSVPINEARGIYITQSTDNGGNWSSPIRVFDAVSEDWERVDQPRISIGKDGVLHLIFIRSTIRERQSVGLYYSRSVDGGKTWSNAQALSEGEIQWADIVSYNDQTIHVVWQEYDGLVFANISQVSTDNGITWGKQNSVTGVNENPTPVSLASDMRGLPHFIQLIEKQNLDEYNQKAIVLQDWKWDGTNWNLEFTKNLAVEGEDVTYTLSSNITSAGYLCVFIPIEYVNPTKAMNNEVMTLSRFLDDIGNVQLSTIPVIPTFSSGENAGTINENTTAVPSALTPDVSILYNDNLSTSPLQKNIAGLILVGIGVIATIVLLLWRRPAKRK